MQNINSFLTLLQNVKTSGQSHWMASCPCSGHTTPGNHLSVTFIDNKILLKCFGNHAHSGEEIANALGLQLTDLFIEDANKPKIVAEYSYHDIDGKELYQVVRYDPKDFRQRHRNGNGEWIWNLKGVPRVLYHLPDILGENSIWIVEGEKDADALWSWGRIATTSCGGAQGWRTEYADTLKGKNVCIIPDNDEPGRQYARDIIASLEGKARSISLVILPSPAKDISDWLNAGNDIETLESLKSDKLDILDKRDGGDGSDTGDTGDEEDLRDAIGDIGDISISPGLKKTWGKKVLRWLSFHQNERFDLDTISRHLDVRTAEERHAIVKALFKQVSLGKLEKVANVRPPIYTYINRDIDYVKWVDAPDDAVLDIKWPYGVEDDTHFGFDGAVQLSPGDVIVVAGLSNTGKTAFALNFLMANMDNFSCSLMGNEITPSKFKYRINQMGWADPLKEDGTPKFEVFHRHDDWKYAIRPENINIIDWLNLDGTSHPFYEIGSIIEGIQRQLTTGIVMILIQKDANKDLGLGGGFSQHLASLYLAMDFERLTIKKAKAWHGHNPNNETYGFKLYNAGTMFGEIRKIRKCTTCYGTGKTKGGECPSCQGTGWSNA